MPSLADILAAIATATSAAITAAQMVALCDYAIAALATSGKPLESYSIGGREFRFDIKGWTELRAHYLAIVDRGTTGGYVAQQAEF